MEKIQLRRAVLQQLKALAPEEAQRRNEVLLTQLLASPAYQQCETLATYLALPHEFDTAPLIVQAQLDGKRVLVPKVMGLGQMSFVAYRPDQLIKSKMGIWEPASKVAVSQSEIDLIHVPGVVFNSRGYRIGYGGGFYDRYLQDFSGQTISTIYDFQRLDFVEAAHDISVMEVLED